MNLHFHSARPDEQHRAHPGGLNDDAQSSPAPLSRTLAVALFLASLAVGVMHLLSGCTPTCPKDSYYNRNYDERCLVVDDWRDYCSRDGKCWKEERPE